MNIAALVSGGVDSSVVVHRLKEAGVEPVIFYIRIGMQTDDGFLDCPSEEDIEITSFIARKYGLKFEIVPLHKEYWDTVVAYTIDTVKRGLTPNPDVMCNKLIKFGAFEEKYGKDFDFLATGHYARTATLDNIVYLSTAADKVKDQTYFLGQLNAVQISRLMFPIGDPQKHEVREIALQQGLPSATRKDSQGICFLGKINYNDFIRRYLGTRRGKIVDIETGTMLGEHEGFWFHTIGQRKGLGLSGGPWYVIDKNIDDNVIFVARGYDTSAQYGKTVRMRGFRYISGNPLGALDKPASVPVAFKIRHTPEFTFGTLQKVVGTDASCVSAIDNGATIGDGFANNDLYILESDTPLQGIASGQFAVVYDKDCRLCLGSGVIA